MNPEFIHGAVEIETTALGLRPLRLRKDLVDRFCDTQFSAMQRQPSGVRIVCRTTATSISLTTFSTRVVYLDSGRPGGKIDVLIDAAPALSTPTSGGDTTEVDFLTGATQRRTEGPQILTVDGLSEAEKLVEFWLPHNEEIEILSLEANAELHPVKDDRPMWVNYGSSISQGSNATSPSKIWPALAAQEKNMSLLNLGFGGSAMLDSFMARMIRDTPADLITAEIGINIVNGDVMRRRGLESAIDGFISTIRDGHTETPIKIISPFYCPIHEKTPGPGAFDTASFGSGQIKFLATGEPDDLGRLTLEMVREVLEGFVEKQKDPHLSYIDGASLYQVGDAPLPDNLHPDEASHALIAQRLIKQL
ncbi:GDSL-like Lipase [Corynebacterium suranareeae]|uniref:GDSL-like Lipase n=1 Tax=Corynebacterium suranareeae TaxID=2506452 RepID=A0A160PUD7_9CORY|nr:SGNH/GDSL hydrolase family protein [Corynebacterium suranareeae]BAU96721.1 GDSL-like Lipase [Corynebacterium suranareeae]